MSNLPELPSGFGRDSAYPPMPTRHTDHGAKKHQSATPRPAFMASPPKDLTGVGGGMPRSSSHNDILQADAPVAVLNSDTSANTNIPGTSRILRRPRSFQPLAPETVAAPTIQPVPAPIASPPPQQEPIVQRQAAHEVQHRARSRIEAQAQAQARDAQVHEAGTRERHERGTQEVQAANTASLPTIRVSLPDTNSLREQRERTMSTNNELDKLRWSVQVLKFVERMRASETEIDESVQIWIEEAITEIVQCASHPQPKPEALYARGDLLASGAFPTYVSKDLRSAFSDFERSARMGWAPSWFRIGRDYEMLGDIARARAAYGRGVNLSDVGCMYRIGMAKMLGQLEVPEDMPGGASLLQAAADASTVDTPHPAYVYGLILTGELPSVPIPLEYFASPEHPSPTYETLMPLGREYLQRAAYLNLPAAQSKCGWCYEHAQLSFPFDPLMSVQYYSAASQGGEPEADMALSKWFLCGAEGCFDKNESLAWTFAERAAKHRIPTAEFAMGYYLEVGIGTKIDLVAARAWYGRAAAQGNTDAAQRLAALESSQSEALSRAQHQAHLNERLYSAHQEARKGLRETQPTRGDLARRRTLMMAEASAQRRRAPRDARAPPVTSQNLHIPSLPATARPMRAPQSFSDMGYQPRNDKDCVIC